MKHIKDKVAIFWFRRDLRMADNVGLNQALNSNLPVLPIFIFDTQITKELPENDARITFIYDSIFGINEELKKHNSGLYCLKGKPEDIWKKLMDQLDIGQVYANEDYEPYAIKRDSAVKALLALKNIPFYQFKDQVIFAKNEIIKNDNSPYTVYTPYKNKWLEEFAKLNPRHYLVNLWEKYAKTNSDLPSLEELGFKRSTVEVLPIEIEALDDYATTRNFPSLNKTSKLSPHLRFGTVSIRTLVYTLRSNSIFLNELIWREFFMQILYNFPQVVTNNFKSKYDSVKWLNNEIDFKKWCEGKTGYPMVDAGMRELNETGYMHNRVRMITAGFLCKHLLIDWKWGEAYFAKKLLDYELSSNNGNWQWAAGTGCDAAPYFRIFNPETQIQKFDKNETYIKKWIPELGMDAYPKPIIEHKFARSRALEAYKVGLNS